VLVLPNVGALSDAQVATLRRFVERGGSLVATGDTSRCVEWGRPSEDFALAVLFGCRKPGNARASADQARGAGGRTDAAFAPSPGGHTYLRLSPELRARVDGPEIGDEPAPSGSRHPVLAGFEETDILAFGGALAPLEVAPGAVVPLTFVPPFPTYPPETAWMRQPVTDIPGLILSEHGPSRVAYLAADIDRRYAIEHLPDHARLLANIVRWASGSPGPLSVEGTGLIDCHVYEQPGRLILHLVNLTSEATWRAPLVDLIRVGPFTVRLRLTAGLSRPGARLLVSGGQPRVTVDGGFATFRVDSILDHEIVVLE
jgi:hypothetical protein